VAATLEIVEEVEVCEVELLVAEEPREPDWLFAVEIPELEAVGPMLSAEYAAIPAASIRTTTATIQMGRMAYRSYGRSFLNPWLHCSIGRRYDAVRQYERRLTLAP
jgi:hypothetical protein